MDTLAPTCEQEAEFSFSPEARFIRSTSLMQRKKRGQFFTPSVYANIMVDWITAVSPRSVLDPAVGTGVLLDICQQRSVGQRFTGYDVDPLVLELAEDRLETTELRRQDFLSGDWDERFDAIIANPPYIVHREHDVDPKIADLIAHRSGHRISRQSNLYVYFVIKICEQLAHGGRAAIVIPAEWMSANYGQPLKAYLLDKGLLHGLITIDYAGHAFADNMATASILLIEKGKSPPELLQSHYVPDGVASASLAALEQNPVVVHQILPAELLRSSKKWGALLFQPAEKRAEGSVKLSDLVTTKRGIATGANRFFLMSREEAHQHSLDTARMDRCVGKTAQVAGISFTDADFERLADAGQACFLFNPKGDLTPAEAAYIKRGDLQGIPLKHGPRTKRVWYTAEVRKPAPIWASVFGRGRMRFVYNAAGVKALTCFHGLYPRDLDPTQTRALAALLGSDAMQRAIAEHVRRFAGGLMKLEPRDILDIDVPDIRLVPQNIVGQLADWLDDRPPDRAGGDRAQLERLTALVFQFFDGVHPAMKNE